MFYTDYRGRTVGRILGYIEHYCGLKYAEYVTVHDGKVTYYDRLLATYTWDNENTDEATLIFYGEDKKYFEKNQIIKKKYVDDIYALYNLTYTVQEVKRYLTNNLVSTREGFINLIKRSQYDWDDNRVDQELDHLLQIARQI